MARLPQPGGDEGTWGEILNQYLLVAHAADGSLKDDAVDGATIKDASISEAKLDAALTTKVNSGGSDPAVGGDLSGTASTAQIVAGAVGATELAANAVTTAKITDANVTGGKLADSAVSTTKIADANVTTAKLADSSVTLAKLSTASAPTAGQLLVYNGTTLGWTDPGTVPTNLDDLSDVAVAGATDGQALVYQSGSGNWIPATVSSGGVTDHGALTGLSDDDHPQYHNDTRGDARYYTKSEVDTSLAGKADDTDPRLSDERTPTDGSVTEPKLAASNAPSSSDVLTWDGANLTWAAAAAGGETNTASNVGSAGVGVFKQKTGSNLEFKRINAGSNKISITDDIGNDELDIDVVTANLGLTSSDVGLGNVDNTSDANKPISTATQTALDLKVDETISVSGGTSLTGGGTLTTDRTLTLVNDSATPGNTHYYGTDGTGTKGYFAIPTQDPTMGGDISGTASNAQIVADAVGTTELADSAVTDAKIASGVDQAKITNLTSDLAGKESTITAGTTADYWRGDKSWQTLDKSAVGLANVDNTSDATKNSASATLTNKTISGASNTLSNIAQSSVTNLTTDLAAKLDDKNETVTLTDSTNDKFVRVDINDDASPTSGWIDRLAFYFSGTRTGYHNEYGELRARPAKNNTVALRAMGWNGASSAYILEVANNSSSATYFGVTSSQIDATVPISSNSNITTTGTVNGSNIGAKVTTSSTAPSSPSVGDVWVDTST